MCVPAEDASGNGDIGGLDLLIGDAEKARTEVVCCQLDCARGAWERRDSVEGRTARRHRAIEAMMEDGRVVRVGEGVDR